MDNEITIKATMPAWAISINNVQDTLDAVKRGNHAQAIDRLAFYSGDMATGSNPWTLVGEADITVRLKSGDELTANQIKALKAELDHARSEWLTTQQQILERISKLQALPAPTQATE